MPIVYASSLLKTKQDEVMPKQAGKICPSLKINFTQKQL